MGADPARGTEWLSRAAEQGFPRAQSILGVCRENGTGVALDPAEAARLYRQAAEQGYAPAQCNLGVCYLNGIGVEEDESTAIDWLERSAAQEFPRAQSILADCLQAGRGTAEDLKRAEAGRSFRFLLVQPRHPGKVVGLVGLNEIVRGAFQSCFLSYKTDAALWGRGYGSEAIAAVTDVGLADALLRRLAELDPAAYAEASERMALKARRAAERKAEQAAHEKNVRRGKRRAKEAPVPAEKRPAAGSGTAAHWRKAAGERPQRAAAFHRSRPPKDARPKPRAQTRFAHSRPVKKGKGSFRRKDS